MGFHSKPRRIIPPDALRMRAPRDRIGHDLRRKSENSPGRGNAACACAQDQSRSSRFRILPVGPLGSSLIVSTIRGYL